MENSTLKLKICDHQASPARNIKGGGYPVGKEAAQINRDNLQKQGLYR